MTTIQYGKRAYAKQGLGHAYEEGTLVEFIEMGSEFNVNDEEKYYIFKSVEDGLLQTLEEFEFEWVEER